MECMESQINKENRCSIGPSQVSNLKGCIRASQYTYLKTEKDFNFSDQQLRIFEFGYAIESLAKNWLKDFGFDILSKDDDGKQVGFSTSEGRFRGKVDGVITNINESVYTKTSIFVDHNGMMMRIYNDFAINTPMIWECKSANNKNFIMIQEFGIKKIKPEYCNQVYLYQAFMEKKFQGISKNYALITIVNKDTCSIYNELIGFDKYFAQKASDRVAEIIEASENNIMLERTKSFLCNSCHFRKKCLDIE
jgi:hypothetical protein